MSLYSEEYYQSPEWAKLVAKTGVKIETIQLQETTTQIYVHKLGGPYSMIHIPRGPLLRAQISQAEMQFFFNQLTKVAQKHQSLFSLIEPGLLAGPELKLIEHYTKATNLEKIPHQTQILDLCLSRASLLAQMHPKMRYNIKLAQKKDLSIQNIHPQQAKFDDYFDNFYKLMQETQLRNKFAIHSKDHYRNLLTYPSNPNLTIQLKVAEWQQTVLAANILLDTPNQRVYVHGASSNRHRKLMAAPLLQWESIQEAKLLGKKSYDFWGISDTRQSWAGITRFKKQFGGQSLSYPKSRLYIHQPYLFTIYSILRRLRQKAI